MCYNIKCNISIFCRKMSNQALSIYDRQKMEAKRILKRITYRQQEQLQRERSEGFQIVDDLKDQLRRSFRHSQTERINSMRRRQKSENFSKVLTDDRQETRRFTCPRIRRKMITKKLTEVKNELALSSHRNSTRLKSMEKNELESLFKQIADSLRQSKSQISSQKSKLDVEEPPSVSQETPADEQTQIVLSNYKQNKTFLPMLELYVQERLFLKTMSKQQERTHSIIIQMLTLALARRKNKKLLDALDMLIEVDNFFPKVKGQMDHLKSVWYQMIAKLYLEIKNEQKKQKANRMKGNRLAQYKRYAEMKRQKTIMIRSLSSKKNFLDRVSLQLKKMELVHETSYLREAKDQFNVRQQSEEGELIVVRASQSFVLSFPQPASLFPTVQGIQNYGVAMISRDRQTRLFPTHYPLALSTFMGEQQYMSAICKVNSILVPSTRCFTFESSLNIHYESIFCIFLILLLAILVLFVFAKRNLQGYTVIALIFTVVALLIVVSLKIHFTAECEFGKSNEIYTSISKILAQLADRHEESCLKFSISDGVDMLVISYPKNEEEQSGISEQTDRQSDCKKISSSRLKTLKCSSNQKFLASLNSMLGEKDASQQDQSELKFKKELQQLQSIDQLQKTQGERYNQSSDQVIQSEERDECLRIKSLDPSVLVFDVDSEEQ